MENFSIERPGIPNLDFTGEVIGQSSGTIPRVKIYRTQGLKYVGQWGTNQKTSQAQHFDTPAGFIAYFRNTIGINSDIEDALEDAAKHDDGFKIAWNEHVD